MTPLELERENRRLEQETPEARLAFAVETFGEDLLFTSSFGAQSGLLLHLWSRIARHLPVVFIDTGFLHPETLRYRDELVERLGLVLHVLTPDIDHADFVERHGSDIPRRDPDFCCAINKVAPLEPLRARARGWVSGLRRDQSEGRGTTPILQAESRGPGEPDLVRVHPIATLTRTDVTAYFAKHAIPEHPLKARRYLSIGCAPCTRAVSDGEGERGGRWAWSNKTECGLHLRRARSEARS